MERRKSPIALGVALGLLALALSGCWSPYRTAVIPPPGFLYADVSAPLIPPDSETGIADLSDVEVHTAHFQVPFLLGGILTFAWDEASVQAAVDASGFREIVYADYHWFNILSIYSELTVRVYGRR